MQTGRTEDFPSLSENHRFRHPHRNSAEKWNILNINRFTDQPHVSQEALHHIHIAIAASLHSQQQEAQSATLLHERLRALPVPLHTVTIAGDGQCLYRALAHQTIARKSELGMWGWHDLRMAISGWLQENATYPVAMPGNLTTPLSDYLDPIDAMTAAQITEFESMDLQAKRAYETQIKTHILHDPKSAWHTYCDNVSSSRMQSILWGDMKAIIALANIFQRPVHVFSANGESYDSTHYPAGFQQPLDFADCILLAHVGNKHFDSVVETPLGSWSTPQVYRANEGNSRWLVYRSQAQLGPRTKPRARVFHSDEEMECDSTNQKRGRGDLSDNPNNIRSAPLSATGAANFARVVQGDRVDQNASPPASPSPIQTAQEDRVNKYASPPASPRQTACTLAAQSPLAKKINNNTSPDVFKSKGCRILSVTKTGFLDIPAPVVRLYVLACDIECY